MAKERLDIIVSAEVEDAAKSIKKLADIVGIELKEGEAVIEQFEQAIKDLEKTAKASQTPEELAKITSQLNEAKKGLANFKAGKDVFSGLSKGAANATPALTNLGRVIQDAPFGIIGIANNIDPLLSSLQSLSKQSGGAGGALKALGGALLGPAGIAIGVSAVTSALIAFGPQISKAIGGVSEFDQTLRNAAGEGAKAFAGASESFGNFVRIVNDGEASVTRQNDALKNANSALSAYGLEVGSVSQLQKQGSAIGAIYAQIKQEEAKSSILAAKAAEEYAKGVALGIAIEQGDTLGAAGALSLGNLVKSLLTGGTAVGSVATAVAGLGDAFGEANSKQQLYEKENEKTKLGIDSLIKSLGQVPGVVEKTDKARAKSAEITRENNQEEIIANTNRKAAVVLVNQETAGLLALSKAAEAAFLAKQKNNNIDKQKALGGALGTVGPVQRALDPAILQKQKEFADQSSATLTNLETKTNNAQQAFSILTPAIDATFGALASGENVGEALAASLKQVVVQLIAAVAKALILQAILSAFTGGGAAGGGFLKILTGALGFRAAGGPLTGGPTIVGERGPELLTNPGYGNISPNSQMGGTLSAVVSGNDLLFILNQANSNRRGNFG